jgi:hypothetical protein
LKAGYDLIGDLHGCVESLRQLLKSMGYQKVDGVYRHDSRKALFLGDFIDRGPSQRQTIELVRPMIEQGYALAVMGNHEFNAIAYHSYDEERADYLRRHTPHNNRQHRAFLDAYADTPDEYDDVVGWFKTLPLWLDLGDIRVVHACWDEGAMLRLKDSLGEGNRLTDALLKHASTYARQEFRDVETLLKGKEVPLINGHHFVDSDGNEWPNIRIRWWDQQATTYQSAFMGAAEAIAHIPDDEIEGDHLIEYAHSLPPVFLGHYWMDGEPRPLADNIACVDYSVAKMKGKLAAYRWDGEQTLSAEKFVSVERVEP